MKIADRKKASILVLLLLSTFLSFASVPALYGDRENWLEGWSYRKSNIIEQASGAGTNYQVKITVHYDDDTDSGEHVYLNSKCQSDFDDIRFTDDDGWTLLDYWMESKDPGTSAVFWVEVQDDLSSSDATIYIYYGNDEATTTSNGDNTFLFFDHFEGDSIDTDKWQDYTEYVSVSDSTMTFQHSDGVDRWICQDATNYPFHEYPYGYAFRGLVYIDNTSWGHWGFRQANKGNDIAIFYNEGALHEQIFTRNTASSDLDADWTAGIFNLFEITLDGTYASFFYNGVEESNSPHSGLSIPDADLGMHFIALDGIIKADWVLTRKFVDPEPTHGDWGEERWSWNYAPTNLSFAFLDMDDTDNLYAQKQYYTAQYVVSDYDGYADIDYAEFSIMQSSTVRATFRFEEDTSTFSIEAGSSAWDLDVGSCSYVSSGKTITMNFTISPKFNAVEESDVDISAFVVDDEPENDTDTIQTEYADVVTDLVVSGFACDDDRGNVGQYLEFSGAVSYANNPSSGIASSSYPPDSEFTAVHVYDSRDVSQGSDNSIINGVFSVSFSALYTVDLETYNPYIDMADAEYIDAEESPTATFISDRIRILTLGADNTRVNVDDSAEIYATAELEYGGHSLGSGDGLTIGSLDLIWNTTHFVGAESKPSVQQKVYDLGEGEETIYGVTALNLDSRSVSVIWDRLNVTFTVEDDLVPLNTETEFKVTIFREYDNSSVSSYSYNINRDGSGFSNPHTTEAFTDVCSSEGTRIYDFTNVTDNTYGLTAFTDPDDLFVAWYDEGIQLNQIALIIAIALIVTAIAAGIGLLIYRRKRK
jgi:hypothetical protein